MNLLKWQNVLRFAKTRNNHKLSNTITKFLDNESLDWQDLKLISEFFPIIDDHYGYEYALVMTDPRLQLFCKSSTNKLFVGKRGYGGNTLNCYRKIVLSDLALFEKVYYSKSIDFFRCLWFYNNILPLVDSKIVKAPKLHSIDYGNFCNICYFEFIDLGLQQEINQLNRVLEVIKYFFNFDTDLIYSRQQSQGLITNFRSEFMYGAGFKTARTFLSKYYFDDTVLYKWEARVKDLKKVPTHGDLTKSNLGRDSYIIDWDKFGIYPIGYDLAYFFSKSLSFGEFEKIHSFLENAVKFISNNEEIYNQFIFSTLFFCFIFYSNQHESAQVTDTFLLDTYHYLIRACSSNIQGSVTWF